MQLKDFAKIFCMDVVIFSFILIIISPYLLAMELYKVCIVFLRTQATCLFAVTSVCFLKYESTSIDSEKSH